MTRAIALCAALSLALPVGALAHVGVRPAESKPAAEERYTVRVPTEGAVATASVHLEIPDGVTVLEVDAVEGGSATTEWRDGRIVGITWTKAIPPKQSSEFTFRARNPETGTAIAWKAHQHFVDGSVTAWVGPAGDCPSRSGHTPRGRRRSDARPIAVAPTAVMTEPAVALYG